MLTIIMGAGASYDSDPEHPTRYTTDSSVERWRPPLARSLFSEKYGQIAEGYPAALALFPQLRRAGSNIEQELENIYASQVKYPRTYRQLLSMRYYLRDVLLSAQDLWNREVIHKTSTYLTLLDRVDRWKTEWQTQGETVGLVTFNYDTLLDDACEAVLTMKFPDMGSYISNDKGYQLYKVHGSVNWKHKVTFEPILSTALDSADKIKWTGDYVINQKTLQAGIGVDYIPAIAIPTATKKSFELPDDHVARLAETMKKTTILIIIGWRGAEKHFLELWKNSVDADTLKVIQIVNADPKTAAQIYQRLRDDAGVTCEKVYYSYKGFSRFVAEELQSFLISTKDLK